MADKFLIHGAAYCGDGSASNEAPGSTVTISNATPGVVSWAGHPFNNNDPVYFTTTGALPTGLSANTKYFVRNRAANTFEVSATSGGASIATSSAGSGVHTATGVGAWNNINVFTGTAPAVGALAAGDTVFIRSKTSAGANITITLTAATYLGSASATSTSWIKWVIDSGTVWSGVSGTVTTAHAVAWTLGFRAWNEVIAEAQDSLVATATGNSAVNIISLPNAAGLAIVRGLKVDTTGQSAGGTAGCPATIAGSRLILVNPTIKLRQLAATGFNMFYANTELTLVNPTISVGLAPSAASLFYIGDSNPIVTVIGGSLSGSGTTTGNIALAESNAAFFGRLEAMNFKIPPEVVVARASAAIHRQSRFEAMWADGGYGSEVASNPGVVSSRDDGNFPYLNATLPDASGTPWSWKAYLPRASLAEPFSMLLAKVSNAAAAVRTITVNFMAANSLVGSLDKSNTWVEIGYTDDATGAPMLVQSKTNGAVALDASTASWSSTSYGAISCSTGKKQIALTTPTSIKAGTKIMVRFYCTVPAAGVSDIFFVCPDPVVV